MYRPMLSCAFLLGTVVAAQQPADQSAAQQPAGQQSAPSDKYQGQSTPPADDVIVTAPDEPQPKPPAGKRDAQPAAPMPDAAAQPPAEANPAAAGDARAQDQGAASATSPADPSSTNASADIVDPDVTGTDDGIVGVAKQPQEPGLHARTESGDPDGDIVHPHPLAPGELADGTTVRVHLLTRLSTVDSQPGEVFRTQVATDVLQDGQVLIPAGAEIDGKVVQVASGTIGSHGTMLLRPDTVIMPDGTRHPLDAQLSGAPGTKTRVNGEGYVDPGSRLKMNGVKYGAGVGAGAVTGAMIGGPVGALTGGIIGAGAITVHLLMNHSDAVLQPGAVLLFTLDSRLDLGASANTAQN